MVKQHYANYKHRKSMNSGYSTANLEEEDTKSCDTRVWPVAFFKQHENQSATLHSCAHALTYLDVHLSCRSSCPADPASHGNTGGCAARDEVSMAEQLAEWLTLNCPNGS